MMQASKEPISDDLSNTHIMQLFYPDVDFTQSNINLPLWRMPGKQGYFHQYRSLVRLVFANDKNETTNFDTWYPTLQKSTFTLKKQLKHNPVFKVYVNNIPITCFSMDAVKIDAEEFLPECHLCYLLTEKQSVEYKKWYDDRYEKVLKDKTDLPLWEQPKKRSWHEDRRILLLLGHLCEEYDPERYDPEEYLIDNVTIPVSLNYSTSTFLDACLPKEPRPTQISQMQKIQVDFAEEQKKDAEVQKNDNDFFHFCFGKNADPTKIHLGMLLVDNRQNNLPYCLYLTLFHENHYITTQDFQEHLFFSRKGNSFTKTQFTLQKTDDLYKIFFNDKCIAQCAQGALPTLGQDKTTLDIIICLLLKDKKQAEAYKCGYHGKYRLTIKPQDSNTSILLGLAKGSINTLRCTQTTTCNIMTSAKRFGDEKKIFHTNRFTESNYNMLHSSYNPELKTISLTELTRQVEERKKREKKEKKQKEREAQEKEKMIKQQALAQEKKQQMITIASISLLVVLILALINKDHLTILFTHS